MKVMLTAINELQRRFNDALGRIGSRLADRGYARNPLLSKPTATTQVYRELAEEVAARIYPEIDEFEAASTYAIAPAWLHDLALHTQVVVKKSPLCYAHGRILYSALSKYLFANPLSSKINIVETGTARGFSSLCMAWALHNMGRPGSIMTSRFSQVASTPSPQIVTIPAASDPRTQGYLIPGYIPRVIQ